MFQEYCYYLHDNDTGKMFVINKLRKTVEKYIFDSVCIWNVEYLCIDGYIKQSNIDGVVDCSDEVEKLST